MLCVKSLCAHPDLEYNITYLHAWYMASCYMQWLAIHYIYTFTKSSDILNKNSLAVKKCEANQKQDYKRPKYLISRKAKKTKLYIPNLL